MENEKEIIVLTLNCGSSSVKYSVFNWDKKEIMCEGIVERIGLKDAFLKHNVFHKKEYIKREVIPDHHEAIKVVTHILTDSHYGVIDSLDKISVIAHRVVHGGEYFTSSVLIDGPEGKVVKTFRNLSVLAPLHNPNNILGIISAMEILPNIPHIAVMDTAFHQTMPKHAFLYAIPMEYYTQHHIRKYGFHGTSHLYVSKRAAVLLGKKPSEVNLITCHIGNGVSFTAIKNGQSYDHSMGFTPLEGLIMGTRSGDLDPAIISYICEIEQVKADKVVNMLNKESGLKAISGGWSDRRDIYQKAQEGDERSQLAIEMEVHRIKKYIGAYTAILGKVDAIVFTAGAGEMAWWLREKVLENMENLGVILDKEKNKKAVSHYHEFVISADNSPVKVFVIPTNEELVMVEDAVAILKGIYDVHTKFTYSFEDPNYVNKMHEELYKKELKKKL